MIVDRADLDEALQRAAELDAALRRHPHDEGLRQRLRTVVERIRRLARALERGGVLLLAVVALVACADIPEPSNREVAAPAGGAAAAAIAVQEWADRLGAELDVEDLPPIRWFEGDCLDFGHGFCPDGATHFFWSGEEIHLLVREKLHETSLAHEVLHWSIHEAADGDPDGDHEHWAWAEVGDVCAVLREAGL